MATVTHYIRSSYSPSQRDRFLRETGQAVSSSSRSPSPAPVARPREREEDLEEAWRREPTFGARRRAPKFVRARVRHDESGNIIGGADWLFDEGDSKGKGKAREGAEDGKEKVAGWYRALVASREERAAELDRLERGKEGSDDDAKCDAPGLGSRQQQQEWGDAGSAMQVNSTPSAIPSASSSSMLPSKLRPRSQFQTITQLGPAARRSPTNNWFTTRPLAPTPPPSRTASTLADLLARDPPPDKKSGDGKAKEYKPPVFLHLGPENVGWRMLEKGGWREGEGLGVNVRRVRRDGKEAGKEKEEQKEATVKEEELEVIDVDEVVSSEGQKEAEIIDLTGDADGSQTEEEDGFDEFTGPVGRNTTLDRAEDSDATLSDSESAEEEYEQDEEFEPDPTRTTLLTPLPTVLKADKLGIGLHHRRVRRKKAKKVTHTRESEAMREHIRRGEDMRRKQKEVGRGRRGFERMRRREEDERRRLISYLNS